jgi:3',5'-cyclic AMP phosphodiesterase CpdA
LTYPDFEVRVAFMKIAHVSDLHFGARTSSEKLRFLRNDLLEQSPELLVLTGDITDRGRISEFRWAHDFLQSLGIPYISVPGNREIGISAFWEWMFPFFGMRRYSKFFGQSDRVTHFDNDHKILLIGLNSVHPFPSWPGKINRDTRYWLRAFAAEHSDWFKVLFLHHPVIPVIRASSFWAHALSDAGELLNIGTQAGIQLILQGHKHRSAVVELGFPQRQTKVVVSCGGAPLMSQWDASYHLIRIKNGSIAVNVRECGESGFAESGVYHFRMNEKNPGL